jgi:hypothetical protein
LGGFREFLLFGCCLWQNRLRIQIGALVTDAAFNDNVGRTADHDQMFDIIAADQNDATAGIDRCSVQNLQPGLAVAATAHEGRGCPVAQDPEHDKQAEKGQADAQRCNEKTIAIGRDQVIQHVVLLLTGFLAEDGLVRNLA